MSGVIKKKCGRSCLVCSARTTNLHLGVDACRACAAFYKRSVGTNKVFVCRQGDGKYEQYMCRKCRFDRCHALKMEVNGPFTNLPDSTEPTPLCPKCAPSSSESTLARISRCYTEYHDRRRINELALRVSTNYRGGQTTIDGHEGPLFLSSIEYEEDITPTANIDLIRFLSDAFPEYSTLSAAEQQAVFKCCKPIVYNVEGVWFCRNIDMNRKIAFTGVTSVLDFDHMELFCGTEVDAGRQDTFRKTLLYYYDKACETLLPAAQRISPTDTESRALLAILMWSFDAAPTMAPHIVEIGERIIDNIFNDLGQYYREDLMMEDYATKIGEMMSLATILKECVVMQAEEFQTYNLLDIFEDKSYFHKTFVRDEPR